MNLPRTVTKLFTANIITQVIGFLGITFFARQLGAEGIGIYFLFQALLSILSLPADIGIREGIEKRISEGRSPEQTLTTGLLLKLGFTSVLVLVIYFLKEYINGYVGANITYLLIIGLVFNSLSEVAIRTLKGELRVGETATLDLVRQVVWVCAGAIFILEGFGYTGLIYGVILGYGVVFIWGMVKKSTKFGHFSRDQVNSLWIYSKYSFVGAVGGLFYGWLDVAVIGYFLPQTYVGAYEIAWKIGAVVTTLSNTIAITIFPQVSKWDSDSNKEKIESLLSKTITPSLIFVFPAFFGSLLLSQEVLGLLFGEDFTVASIVLIIFMMINFIQAITVIAARALRAINRPKLIAKARAISITVNLILNIILVWKFGIIGAAVSTGIALSIYTLLTVTYLRKFIKVIFPRREVGWCIFASLGMSCIVLIIKYIFDIDSVLKLLGIVGIGALSYFTLIFLYTPLRNKITDNIKNILYDNYADTV